MNSMSLKLYKVVQVFQELSFWKGAFHYKYVRTGAVILRRRARLPALCNSYVPGLLVI